MRVLLGEEPPPLTSGGTVSHQVQGGPVRRGHSGAGQWCLLTQSLYGWGNGIPADACWAAICPPLVCHSHHAGSSRHPVRPQGPCALLAVGQAGAEYRRGAAVTTAAPTASTAATTTRTTSTTSTAAILLLAVWANVASCSLPGLLGSADFSHNGSLRHLAGGSCSCFWRWRAAAIATAGR